MRKSAAGDAVLALAEDRVEEQMLAVQLLVARAHVVDADLVQLPSV